MNEQDNYELVPDSHGLAEQKNAILPNRMLSLQKQMLDSSRYTQLMDQTEYDPDFDYSAVFNDLEMIYLFVHHERDLDKQKNRTEKTKKEYLRELLFFYNQISAVGDLYNFDSTKADLSTLLKQLEPKHIRKYQAWLKEVKLGRVKKRDKDNLVEGKENEDKKGTYSVATLSRKTVILKAFFEFLYKRKYISRRLHEALQTSNVHEKDRPNRDLYEAEVLQLLKYFKNNIVEHTIISVLASTGLRVKELCQARICDLSYYEGKLFLEVIGKGNEKREVLIHPKIWERIVTYRSRRRYPSELDGSDTTPLLPDAKGNAYNEKYLSSYISKVINRAPLPFLKARSDRISAHHFRHFFSIYSSQQGASIESISKTLGHKSLATTQIYLQKRLSRMDNAAHTWIDSSFIDDM